MSDTNDIPKLLRDLRWGDYSTWLLDSAADEITRLRAEVAKASADLAQRTAELAQRTAERDGARREACHFQAKYADRCACPPYMSTAKYVTQDAMRLAKVRGWDCFAPHANATEVRVQDGGAA